MAKKNSMSERSNSQTGARETQQDISYSEWKRRKPLEADASNGPRAASPFMLAR